jgi:hypothetical protein
MTLAAILSICFICSAPTPALGAASVRIHSSAQQPDSSQPADSSKAPDSSSAQDKPADSKPQTVAPAAAPASASPPQTPSAKKPSAATKRKRPVKKPPVASPCADPIPASNPAPTDASASGTAANPATSDCPPKKVIRNGGTSEPAIQLTGGASGVQASEKRSTTEQLLGSAQENLEKASARQLNSSQQEMVKQIQQFMEQSKVAVAAGDVERGHNLATKAQLLSDELLKPQ